MMLFAYLALAGTVDLVSMQGVCAQDLQELGPCRALGLGFRVSGIGQVGCSNWFRFHLYRPVTVDRRLLRVACLIGSFRNPSEPGMDLSKDALPSGKLFTPRLSSTRGQACETRHCQISKLRHFGFGPGACAVWFRFRSSARGDETWNLSQAIQLVMELTGVYCFSFELRQASEIARARGPCPYFTRNASENLAAKALTVRLSRPSDACRSSCIQQGSQQELRQGRVVIDDFVQHGSVLLEELACMRFHQLQAPGLQDAPTSDDLAQKLKGIVLANFCHELSFHFLDQVI